jgi:hypothetical protein
MPSRAAALEFSFLLQQIHGQRADFEDFPYCVRNLLPTRVHCHLKNILIVGCRQKIHLFREMKSK